MKKGFLIVLFIVTAQLGFAEDTMKIVIDNISIESPLGWLAQYTKSPNLFFLYSPLKPNDTFQENCNLTVEELYIDLSISEYMQATLDQLNSFYTDFSLKEKGKNFTVYYGILNNVELVQAQYYYKEDNTVYVLTCTSTPSEFDNYRVVFKQIASSFSIQGM